MSEPTPPPQQPEPTTIVGYPDTAAVSSTTPTANPGVAGLRSQVRVVRALVVACLALLLLLTVGLGVGLATSRAQIDDLSAQVAALAARPAVVAAEPAPAPSAAAAAAEQLDAAPTLPAGTARPVGVDETGAVLIGDPDASNVVEVYIDYQCPYCQRFEEALGASLVERALQPGSDLLVKQYNLAFLGETSSSLEPAGASARAASAAACVLDVDGVETFAAFNSAVFAKADPNEPPGQFTAEVLIDLAEGAGASADAVECIRAEEHVPFVAATTAAGFSRGVKGTPTVVVNGTTIGNAFTDPAIPALLG